MAILCRRVIDFLPSTGESVPLTTLLTLVPLKWVNTIALLPGGWTELTERFGRDNGFAFGEESEKSPSLRRVVIPRWTLTKLREFFASFLLSI